MYTTRILALTKGLEMKKKTRLFSKLSSDLQNELDTNSHTKSLRVKVECDNGILKVLGTAKTYFQKQVMLNILMRVRANSQIEIADEVIVKKEDCLSF
jgi:hypothetical protein